MKLITLNFPSFQDVFVPHSELALHLGIAGERVVRAKLSGRYCWVKVAGDPAMHHGGQVELLPHPYRLPDLTSALK